MAKKSIGLKSIKFGPMAADGGMGTVLTQIGATVRESASITTAEGSTNPFDIEELDDPFHVEVIAGEKVFNWSFYDVDPVTLARVLGGEVSVDDGAWEMPDQIPAQDVSAEIETRNGWVIQIPHLSISGRLQWNLNRTRLAQVDVTARILAPLKAGLKTARFIPPAA